MWIDLKDGWRDESTEGPYTETLQTKEGWSISRGYPLYRDDAMFRLSNRYHNIEKKFMTVDDAKQYVDSFEKDLKESKTELRK